MHKTKEQITYNMQQVKSKDTKIEVMLRKELWSRGLESPILFLSVKKLRSFVTASFGTVTIGTTRKMNLNQIKNFGFPKSKEISPEITRLMKHSKIQAGLC